MSKICVIFDVIILKSHYQLIKQLLISPTKTNNNIATITQQPMVSRIMFFDIEYKKLIKG